MSSSSSDSESSYQSDDSEINFIPGYAAMEVEVEPDADQLLEWSSESEVDEPYADEPLADEAWMKEYNKEMKERKEFEEKMQQRFDSKEEIIEWCKCGNCERESLQNPNECYCCCELEECGESLASEMVLQDIPASTTLSCITQHPGFNPVCLQKWSLRLASDKYKTKQKSKYRQIGSEESFLRSIAYREFSRLVYGFLGNRRIPLPACAYSAIRKTFPVKVIPEGYTGFAMEEDDTNEDEGTNEDELDQ